MLGKTGRQTMMLCLSDSYFCCSLLFLACRPSFYEMFQKLFFLVKFIKMEVTAFSALCLFSITHTVNIYLSSIWNNF